MRGAEWAGPKVEAHTSHDLDAIAGDKLDALLALGRHVVRLVVKLMDVGVIGGGVKVIVQRGR